MQSRPMFVEDIALMRYGFAQSPAVFLEFCSALCTSAVDCVRRLVTQRVSNVFGEFCRVPLPGMAVLKDYCFFFQMELFFN